MSSFMFGSAATAFWNASLAPAWLFLPLPRTMPTYIQALPMHLRAALVAARVDRSEENAFGLLEIGRDVVLVDGFVDLLVRGGVARELSLGGKRHEAQEHRPKQRTKSAKQGIFVGQWMHSWTS